MISLYVLGTVIGPYGIDGTLYFIVCAVLDIAVIAVGLFAFSKGVKLQPIAMMAVGDINIIFAIAAFLNFSCCCLWILDLIGAIVFVAIAVRSWQDEDRTFAMLSVSYVLFSLGMVLAYCEPVADALPEHLGSWLSAIFGIVMFAISLIYAYMCRRIEGIAEE